ncbi:MAG: PAS domain S-box protein, partial [Methanomassiliicoccales archaeon]|nr:PAS domain S-box protein [Methanomassiliicoccales archaeon]
MISVLCIDDDESVIGQVKAHLGRTGEMLVEGSPSTPQALEMLKLHHYDAVIIRHGIHGMDGRRFAGQVQNRLGKVPIVFLVEKGARSVAQKSLSSSPNTHVESLPLTAEDYEDLGSLVREMVLRTKQEEFVSFATIAAERMGIATIAIDKSGKVGRFNHETCNVFGYSESELATKHAWDLSAVLAKDRWPGSWQRLGETRLMSVESVGKRADGTTFPVDIMATRETIGGTEYLVAAIRDLTGKKTAEARLRETVESYKTLAENLPGIVYRVKIREKGRMVFFNDMLTPIT